MSAERKNADGREISRSAAASAWLVVAPLLACFADIILTLLGQPASYWHHDRTSVSEFNPAARLLLSYHPFLFVAAGIVTSGIVVLLALYGPRRLAFAVSVLVTVGHTIAAGAWLMKLGPVGWVAAVALLLLVRVTMPRPTPNPAR